MRIWLFIASRRSLRAEFILKCIILFRCILDLLLKSWIWAFLELKIGTKMLFENWCASGPFQHNARCLPTWTMASLIRLLPTSTTNRYNLDKQHRSRPIIWRDTNAFRLKVIEWFIFNWTRNTWSKITTKKMRDNDLITPSHFNPSWNSNIQNPNSNRFECIKNYWDRTVAASSNCVLMALHIKWA